MSYIKSIGGLCYLQADGKPDCCVSKVSPGEFSHAIGDMVFLADVFALISWSANEKVNDIFEVCSKLNSFQLCICFFEI